MDKSQDKIIWPKECQGNPFLLQPDSPKPIPNKKLIKMDRWTKPPQPPATRGLTDCRAPVSTGRRIEESLISLQNKKFNYKYFEPGVDEEPPPQAYKSPLPSLQLEMAQIQAGVNLRSLLEARESNPLLPHMPITLSDHLGTINTSLRVQGKVRTDEVINKVVPLHRHPCQRLPLYYYQLYQVYSPHCIGVRLMLPDEVVRGAQVKGVTAATFLISCLSSHYQSDEDGQLQYCREVMGVGRELRHTRYTQVKKGRARTLRAKIATREAMIRLLELVEAGEVRWDGWSVDKVVAHLLHLGFPSNPQVQAHSADCLHEQGRERYEDACGGWVPTTQEHADWNPTMPFTDVPPRPHIIKLKPTPYLSELDFGQHYRHWYPDYEYLLGLLQYCNTHNNTHNTLATLRVEVTPLKTKLRALNDTSPLELFQEDFMDLWNTLIKEGREEEAKQQDHDKLVAPLEMWQTELGGMQLSHLARVKRLSQEKERIEQAYEGYRVILHSHVVQVEKARAMLNWVTDHEYTLLEGDARAKLNRCEKKAIEDFYKMRRMKVDKWVLKMDDNDEQVGDTTSRNAATSTTTMADTTKIVNNAVQAGVGMKKKSGIVEMEDDPKDEVHTSPFVELVRCVAQRELQSSQPIRRVLRTSLKCVPLNEEAAAENIVNINEGGENSGANNAENLHQKIPNKVEQRVEDEVVKGGCGREDERKSKEKLNVREVINDDGLLEEGKDQRWQHLLDMAKAERRKITIIANNNNKKRLRETTQKKDTVALLHHLDSGNNDNNDEGDKKREQQGKLKARDRKHREDAMRVKQQLRDIMDKNNDPNNYETESEPYSWGETKWAIPGQKRKRKEEMKNRGRGKDEDSSEEQIKITTKMLNDNKAISRYFHSLLKKHLKNVKGKLEAYYMAIQKEESDKWSSVNPLAEEMIKNSERGEGMAQGYSFRHMHYATDKEKMLAERLVRVDEKLSLQHNKLLKYHGLKVKAKKTPAKKTDKGNKDYFWVNPSPPSTMSSDYDSAYEHILPNIEDEDEEDW